MKKIIIMIAAAFAFTACGVGTYSISTGKADEGYLSFTVAGKKDCPVTVYVDGQEHSAFKAVGQKRYRTSDRNIRKTSENTIVLTPGSHDVKVLKNGQEICSKKIFVSPQEHKIVDL